jgi:hypothetical protein
MAINIQSLKEHDYTKKVHSLVRKGTELKKKSQKLAAQINATREQCEPLLHPENQQKKQVK